MKRNPKYNEYLIGKDGTVFSTKTNKKLSCYVGDSGYVKVKVSGKTNLVHRLVAETYIENPENLPQVNHIDNNKQNNNVDNLEWVSNAGNAHHRASEWLVKNVESGEEKIIKNLHIFCIENNLPKTSMYNIAGTDKIYRGWQISIVNRINC
jgi:hypothetical protein